MRILELFSGFGHISDAFKRAGHEVFRVDWSEKLDAELHADVSKLITKDVIKLCGGVPDVVWASPDCTTYSIATHRHRTVHEGLLPKTQYAWECDMTNVAMWRLIDELVELGTKLYFVENPRGRMRHMPFVKDKDRYDITYCSYGRESMKPTDIWTNHPMPAFKPICVRSKATHKHADWSTDVKRDYLSRGKMPEELCDHIAKISEDFVRSYASPTSL